MMEKSYRVVWKIWRVFMACRALLSIFQHDSLQRVTHVFAAINGIFDVIV